MGHAPNAKRPMEPATVGLAGLAPDRPEEPKAARLL